MFKKGRKKFKKKVKDLIKKTVSETGYTISYFPYKNTLNEYIVTKSKTEYPKCEFGLPIPPADFRSGYDSDDESYIKSARIDIENIIEIAKSSGFAIDEKKRILDFGCSSGRMIRCLKPYAEKNEIWGTDVSADHIYWCNEYLNPPFQFATTTFYPHLPFEDKYFDLIYSGSVFTHIDNLIEAWLLELKRVLSENGRLYITIHDNNTIKLFEEDKTIPLVKNYLTKNLLYEEAKKDFNFFAFNRLKTPLIFFDIEYFKKILNPMFDILSVNNESYGYQTGNSFEEKKLVTQVELCTGQNFIAHR